MSAGTADFTLRGDLALAVGVADGEIDLLCIHIAEGLPTDAESAQELDMLLLRK